MRTISANNYKNIESITFDEFSSFGEKDSAINDFFADYEKPYGITTNVIGYLLDDETNETIGYIEESYVDSGSNDYYYTALLYN